MQRSGDSAALPAVSTPPARGIIAQTPQSCNPILPCVPRKASQPRRCGKRRSQSDWRALAGHEGYFSPLVTTIIIAIAIVVVVISPLYDGRNIDAGIPRKD